MTCNELSVLIPLCRMDDRVTRIHCLLDTTSNFGIKQRRHNNKEGDLKIFAKLLYDFYDHDDNLTTFWATVYTRAQQ